MKFLSVIFFFIFSFSLSQELNCRVTLNYSSIPSANKEMFNSMRQSITEFMNNNQWTNEIYSNEERIDCTIMIRINQQISTDEFSGTITIQSSRPVYKSNYNSTLINLVDDQFRFRFVEFESLEFNENTHLSNLTSVLAYYAYIIIGLDYDTFSNSGGDSFFIKAQKIVNNAQGDNNATGWKSFEGSKNRYWLVENLLNPDFELLRQILYTYHREGMDNFTEKPEFVREVIASSLINLLDVYNQRPKGYLIQLFFDAKTDEIVNIFSKGTLMEANELVNVLTRISPKSADKWQKILTNN
ncbi:MAG: hypothetical protein CBC73_03250 [Flavobacteriales bacterium TMED113]|nr:MAG: hypothetical protein CBC73_03250 [Flavobacteriales bacterium TMED113]